MTDRLREDREKNEMNDPYDRPDHFGGFDSTHEMDNEAVESGGEEDDEMGMTTGSQKSMASVSSLLALKRDRIDLKRRATINASSQFADNSRNDNMVNGMRTFTIVQNKSKTYGIAEEHKVA